LKQNHIRVAVAMVLQGLLFRPNLVRLDYGADIRFPPALPACFCLLSCKGGWCQHRTQRLWLKSACELVPDHWDKPASHAGRDLFEAQADEILGFRLIA
jgi:hypothetical protein